MRGSMVIELSSAWRRRSGSPASELGNIAASISLGSDVVVTSAISSPGPERAGRSLTWRYPPIPVELIWRVTSALIQIRTCPFTCAGRVILILPRVVLRQSAG